MNINVIAEQDAIKDILISIQSVKTRAKQAWLAKDHRTCERLMGDLMALEVVLTYECGKVFDVSVDGNGAT